MDGGDIYELEQLFSLAKAQRRLYAGMSFLATNIAITLLPFESEFSWVDGLLWVVPIVVCLVLYVRLGQLLKVEFFVYLAFVLVPPLAMLVLTISAADKHAQEGFGNGWLGCDYDALRGALERVTRRVAMDRLRERRSHPAGAQYSRPR